MGADLEQVRWWSWRRQRLDRSCRGIDDCLASIVAVFGANPQGALSLLARVPRVMPGMVEGAIESRHALRLPAMRRAVWMLLGETAHLPFRAVDQVTPAMAAVKKQGISDEEYARLEREILLAAGRPSTSEEIREAIKRPPDKLAPVLHALCTEGKLLYVKQAAPASSSFLYVATRVWLGHELPEADPDEALVWLAGDYLKAFGPCSVDDFAWWAGVTRERAEPALAGHDPQDIGDGLLMWPGDVHAFEGTRPFANRVNLLPALDPYLTGYAHASRTRFAAPELLPYLYDKTGSNSTSVILIEAAVGGLWDFTLSDRKIEIRIGLFEEPTPRQMESIEAEAGLVAGYFNARQVKITRVLIRNAIAERGPSAYLKPLSGRDTATTPAARPAPKPAATKPAATKPAEARPSTTKGKPAAPKRSTKR